LTAVKEAPGLERSTLTLPDLAFVMGKHHGNRLGFAVLLAFFRNRGRFPRTAREISPVFVKEIARQLATTAPPSRKRKWNQVLDVLWCRVPRTKPLSVGIVEQAQTEGTAPIDPRPPCPDCGAREAQIRTITRRRPTLFGPVEYVDHSEDFFECAGCGKLREDCYPDDPEPDDPEPEIRGFGN
jgi:hypothetical protein